METPVGVAAVLPLHIWAGIEGALIIATIWLYQKELRAAGIWTWQWRKRRNREIAQELLSIRREEIAETIAREILSKKEPPAINDERPQ